MLGIYVYLTTLYVRPQDWPDMPIYNWPINSILLPILFLMAFSSRKKTEGFATMPQHFVMFGLLFMALISNVVNGDTDLAKEQVNLMMIKMIVFYIFLLLPNTFEKLRSIGFYLILMALFISFQGMWQTSTGIGWAHQGMHGHNEFNSMEEMMRLLAYEEPRTFWIGDWDGPNVMALVYISMAPFCFEYIFTKGSVMRKLLGAAAYGCLIIGVLQSGSRGGFLGLTCGGMLFILLRFGVGKGVALGAMILIGVVLFASGGRMGEMNTEEASARERSWLWERGLDWVRERPVVGMGKGSYAAHAGIIAHSNYVENMAETGFTGFFIFVAGLYFSIKGALLSHRRHIELGHDPSDYSFSRAIMISLCAFALSTFFVTMQLEILFTLMGLCGATVILTDGVLKNFKAGWKDMVAIGAICASIYIAVWLIAVKEVV